VSRGAALDLFVCVVYIAPIGSKHENESMFQNLVADIAGIQTLGGIVHLGGDFNAHIAALSDTLDTSDLCELLQALELVETKQPSVVVMRQNHDANVSGWGHKLLDLCCDIGLLILNGRTPSDQSGEFICLVNGGRNTIDYIVSSPAVWQATTHLEVIIDGICYRAMGGNSNHRPLRLGLNINYNFVEPQHTVVTKKFFLPRFNYDKSKVEEYQLALIVSLGNLWVVDLIGYLGADELVDLL